jgi:hypothetical protein
LEQKVDSLVAMVAFGAQAGSTPSHGDNEVLGGTNSEPQKTGISPPFPHLQFTTPRIQCPRKTSSISHTFGSYLFPIPTTSAFTIFDDLQDVISRSILLPENAEKALQHFRNTASNFPFVIISPDTSLDHLRRHKPFLLLSILAMATIDNMKLQKLLDQELRDILGRKVFMSGDRSLDLLQGILVYLTW